MNGEQDNTRRKGRLGENEAAEFLISNGYRIISRNCQTKRGEIDCIAEDPSGTLVFVEVKAASTDTFGHPAFWVNRAKQRKIATLARLYLAEHDITGRPCRFDVITIYKGKIDHIKNAFTA
ncbi:MAG TPA: YraN family protein [Chitinivibrionales bacterium]|nr:YraN family protein [Chitinivibrionales bacterium]